MDEGRTGSVTALAAQYRQQLTAALEAGRKADAERAVRAAVDARLPKWAVYDEVIARAMHEIGAKWAAGDLTVADEHLATSISYGLLALVAELDRSEIARRDEPVVLAAVEGERHVLGLRMAGDMLEAAGFPVFFLGADLPTDALLDLLTHRQVSLCGLTATMPAARDQLAQTVALVSDLLPDVRVLVGGQASVGLTPLPPTAAAVDEVAAVVEAADALLQRAALN